MNNGTEKKQEFAISSFIIPVELDNTDANLKTGNKAFATKDMVFLDAEYEIENQSDALLNVSASDYALANDNFVFNDSTSVTGKKGLTKYWLRDACRDTNSVTSVYLIVNGKKNKCNTPNYLYGLCPAMHLNISSVLSSKHISNKFFKIADIKNTNGDVVYHTIEFGEYPQTIAPNSDELEMLLQENKLNKTGKIYSGVRRIDNDNYHINGIDYFEFEYNGQKYIRAKIFQNNQDVHFSNGSIVEDNKYAWFKVEPIKWIIRNWDEMPITINPNGNGKANFIDVRTEELITVPENFYYCIKDGNEDLTNGHFWQNSAPRAFLNGYDLAEQIALGNGNPEYKAERIYCYKDKGFLQEAFNDYILAINKAYQKKEENKKQIKNPYNLTFEELDNDELLNAYIQSNAAIFLHGPSGVGKSSRVKQFDPDATRITLRPQMNPEEIDGTLDRETGDYIPPLWYIQLCEKCKKEPNRKHVLFIDELTNVKPTVQSLIYSIVLDRAGKDGLWPLPENAVVIAAGNESVDNLAAYPLTNALFRRFSHIYYQINKDDWLNWATSIPDNNKNVIHEQKENKQKDKAKIHPAIVAYIMSRPDIVLNQDLDEENPKIVTDPRKWEIASNVLYSTKNPYALKPAIGEELTADFVEFVQNIQLSVEDVVKGNYDKEEYNKEMNISKKLATIVGLCNATEKDLLAVRKFILNTMGKEILTTYDVLWIRNTPERADIIADCNKKLYAEEEMKYTYKPL